MIKIVSGVYGHQVNGRVYPKDSNSAPFELTHEQEARLVNLGVAVYVDDGSTKLPEGVSGIPEYSTSMKADELREIGKMMGLTFKVGTTKAEMVEQMDAFLAEHIDGEDINGEYSKDYTGDDEESEDDGDDLPKFDAAEAVE